MFNRANPVLELVQSSRTRKQKAEKWFKYYTDQQSEETLALMARQWTDVTAFRVFQVNVVKKIINKRANLYRQAPRRNFQGLDQNTGEAIYKALNADVVLKRASRLTKLFKTTALQVGYDNDTPTLNIVTPNILDVVYTDPQTPTEYIVTHNATKHEHVTYSHWTANTYQRLDYRGQPIPNQNNPDGLNPYGVLPFVPLFDNLPDDQFFLPGGDDLIEAQEAVNVALSNLWRSVELQAHGQPWASGIANGVPSDAHWEAATFGPQRMIYLPEGGSFGFAAPNSPIKDILDALQFVLRQTAATNDLSADVFDLDKRSESGAAKHVEQIDLREARQDDVENWRQYEQTLFSIVKRVVNAHKPGTISEDATVSIDFAEMQESLTETERLNNANKKLELGIWSPVDAILAESPDSFSTREEAMQELLRRKDEAAKISLVD